MGRITRTIPPWVRFSIPGGEGYTRVKGTVNRMGLHTVCSEAKCPNIGECFGCGTATFLILGPVCTRNCLYCAVSKGIPEPPEGSEPERVAEAIARLELNYAVITSVTRDDLPDGGASHFAETIGRIRERGGRCGVEILVPDFSRSMERSIGLLSERRPDVFNHNIEVVRRHFPTLRPMGEYGTSLNLLRLASRRGMCVKSGFMVGFGETMEDIKETILDLRDTGCNHLTVGQYLQPRKDNHPVVKYHHPDEFKSISAFAIDAGFRTAQCGPLVRSSYHAGDFRRGGGDEEL